MMITQLQELEKLNEAYKAFLDAGKTERECVTEIVRQAEAAGYRDLYSMDAVKAGDKVLCEPGWRSPSRCSMWEANRWNRE